MHHKQIDRQMNKTDFIGPLLQSWRFNHVFGNSRIKFGNNQYNKKEYNQHSCVQKVQKGWSLAKLGKITYISFECHRSIDKFLDFHFIVMVKEFIVTKNSVTEIQNLVVNPKSEPPVKSNSKQNQFSFKYVSKINDKIFKINKKNLFCGHFSTKGISPTSSG